MSDDTKNPKDQDSKDPQKSYSEVDIEISDEEIAHSIDHGVMEDRLNYRKLAFWTITGIVLFVVFVLSLINMFDYNKFLTNEQLSAQTEYPNLQELRNNDEQRLNSFGVVDQENKVYHVPIDSAINYMARQGQ